MISMKLYLNYTFFLFFAFMIAFSVITLADDNKIVCLKSDKIRSVDFKKDYMIFEMQKRDKYNITCKGSGYLNFENPGSAEEYHFFPKDLYYHFHSKKFILLPVFVFL